MNDESKVLSPQDDPSNRSQGLLGAQIQEIRASIVELAVYKAHRDLAKHGLSVDDEALDAIAAALSTPELWARLSEQVARLRGIAESDHAEIACTTATGEGRLGFGESDVPQPTHEQCDALESLLEGLREEDAAEESRRRGRKWTLTVFVLGALSMLLGLRLADFLKG